MKVGSDTKLRYHGNFQERQFFTRRRTIVLLAVIGCIGMIVYFLFFSPYLFAANVKFEGFENISEQKALAVVEGYRDARYWGVQPYRNTYLFQTAKMELRLLEAFPSLESVTVEKAYPRTLLIQGKERNPIGVWCLKNDCKYFDAVGTVWGKAIPSTGGLLAVIHDERAEPGVEKKIISISQLLVERLPLYGIAIQRIEIPEDVPEELHILTTKPYIVQFALNGDIEKQLNVLRIFLDQKRTDPAFNPQHYIDLRIADRVYYK